MKLILNILFILLFGGEPQSLDIDSLLKVNMKEYSRIEYTIVSPKNISVKNIKFDTSREVKIQGKYAYIPIETNFKQNKVNSVLTLRIKKYAEVLLSNRKFLREESLDRNGFIIVEKDISDLRFEPFSPSANMELYRAKFGIAENTILQKSMVEKNPDINIDDRVEAIYINNSVNIKFAAVARSKGCIGDVIKVKNDDKKIFRARVINNSTVKIIE